MAAMVQANGEGVPLTLDATDGDKNDTKKRRFLRGLRRMFRRQKNRTEQDVREPSGTPVAPTLRGRSSDQLLTDDDSPKRKRQQSGLSVSHDSVFTPEASGGDSDDERTRHRLRPSLADSVSAELAAAVRRKTRGDTSEDDEDLGLPRSPPGSPLKRGPGRSRVGQPGAEQSSCSEGSLLSAGSSDPEDECRSSKGDLGSIPATTLASVSSIPDSSDADEPPSGLAPLSHSAARHKMAIRPRRTHGPPRRTRPIQVSPGTALPTTPEVNEEIIRCPTPEVTLGNESSETSSSGQIISGTTSNIRHVISSSNTLYENTEIFSHSSGSNLISGGIHSDLIPNDTKLKSSSLPPGLALSQLVGQGGISPMKLSLSANDELVKMAKVSRSKSNAQKRDSSDSEDNLSTHVNIKSTHTSSYKTSDVKYVNLTGELQKKFGSSVETEELIKVEKFEHKNTTWKSNEDTERHYENVLLSHGNKEQSKTKTVEDQSEKHSSKKEESFFGRLLLRKSGKKNKKDSQNEREDDEVKKPHSKEQQIYRNYDMESSRQQKMVYTSDQHIQKSAGHKAFSNQNHKRIDPKGGYVNDPIIQESFNNYSKGSMTEYGMNDFKHFSINELKYSQTNLKSDDNKRSSENVTKSNSTSQSRIRQRVEPLDIPISPELQKKPVALPRSTVEPKNFFPNISQGKIYPSKETQNGSRYIKNLSSSPKITSNVENQYHSSSSKTKINFEISAFGSQSNIQPSKTGADSNMKQVSYSVSPPRSIWPQNSDSSSHMKAVSHGSLDDHGISKTKYDSGVKRSEMNTSYTDFDFDGSKSKPKIAGLSAYQQKISHIGNQIEAELDKSVTDSITYRNPVVKSHSFRLNSEALPNNAQELPSLPPMLGISESSGDSWESSYKKNIKDTSNSPPSLELGSDSLMNYAYKPGNSVDPDVIYSDRNLFDIGKDKIPNYENAKCEVVKGNLYEKQIKLPTHYMKNVSSVIRDNDISRIEANIDSIIGQPKPLNSVTLKSSSLDSVQSFTEKSEQSRKAISNESISQSRVYVNQSLTTEASKINVNKKNMDVASKTEPNNTSQQSMNKLSNGEQTFENHISVTVLNSSVENNKPSIKSTESMKSKSNEFNSTNSLEKSSPKLITNNKEAKISEKNATTPGKTTVPEFMKIQLNKVDQTPISNVVLSTGALIDNKSSKNAVKSNSVKTPDVSNDVNIKFPETERLILQEIQKNEKIINSEAKRIDVIDKNVVKEIAKPHRKFSSEDVEILEKSDVEYRNSNTFNVPLRKNGSQILINRNAEAANNDQQKNLTENKLATPTSLSLKKHNSPVSSLPPLSPTSHKTFIKKKSENVDSDSLKRQSSLSMANDQTERIFPSNVNQAIKRISSQELLAEQVSRIDRSSSSSDDTNIESSVILRKKTLSGSNKSSNKKDDEPELMKVFARRSLKLKDSEGDAIAQDILSVINSENKDEDEDIKKKNVHFNAVSKSRDSDKENEVDSPKDERKKNNDIISDNSQTNNKLGNRNIQEYKKHTTDTAELMQSQRVAKKLIDSNSTSTMPINNQSSRHTICYGLGNYQRSVSANNTLTQPTSKIDNKADATAFKKDISDSTPEKRIRNRTFPDSTNENNKEESIKNLGGKIDSLQYSVDTSSLPKRPWHQIKNDDSIINKDSAKINFRKSSPISSIETKVTVTKTADKIAADSDEKGSNETVTNDGENGTTDGETDASPQFKGILQMRAEWERRAQQAMTK